MLGIGTTALLGTLQVKLTSKVNDAMNGRDETRLAITHETGGEWHDWDQGEAELGVICRHQGH